MTALVNSNRSFDRVVPKTYVVTGSSGFLGRKLCAQLMEDGHIVISATRHREAGSDIPWIEYDLKDGATAANILEAKPDGVFHLAWSTTPGSAERDPSADISTNLVGSSKLFSLLATQGKTKVVFASSGGAVYGESERELIDEDHPLNPISVYGLTKVATEMYARHSRSAHGLDVRVARIANPFGASQPRGKLQGAASIFVRHILNGEEIRIWGDGAAVRDYVSVDDAASGIAAVMELGRDASGDMPTFNIGSGQGLSLVSLIRMIEDLLGKKALIKFGDARSFDVKRNVLSINRLTKLGAWKPTKTLSHSLAEMINDIRLAGR
ncbi:UDP-glucose 4-epimerase [Rhizobium sp. PP-WC-1G-195]|nr:UDP-glucose 4-epimerase [Rhizobium sp. PP-WC-1G-195]TCP74191.1 UDP-glucose 4-epimerase [Rhizobium sp. PP-CC-2G-626]